MQLRGSQTKFSPAGSQPSFRCFRVMEVLSGSGARVWIEDHPTEAWSPEPVDFCIGFFGISWALPWDVENPCKYWDRLAKGKLVDRKFHHHDLTRVFYTSQVVCYISSSQSICLVNLLEIFPPGLGTWSSWFCGSQWCEPEHWYADIPWGGCQNLSFLMKGDLSNLTKSPLLQCLGRAKEPRFEKNWTIIFLSFGMIMDQQNHRITNMKSYTKPRFYGCSTAFCAFRWLSFWGLEQVSTLW